MKMRITKIVLCGIAAVALTGNSFAQEANVSFENKISSDIVSMTKDSTEFAGIKEQVTAEIETEKVDAGISFITCLDKIDENLGLTGYELDKAYVEFRPTDFLSLDFNKNVFAEGSYLPIIDDNVGNGNIASDFSVIARPIENLTVAAGTNLPSVFADAENKADFNLGAIYSSELFNAAATLRSPLNNLGFGIFASFTGLETLNANLGFSYNDEFADVKGNLLTVGATCELSIFAIAFDLVTNFGNQDGTDLYTALCVETGLTDKITLETQASLNIDFENLDATETIAEAGASYTANNHKIRAGVAMGFADSSVTVSLPVYYSYSF